VVEIRLDAHRVCNSFDKSPTVYRSLCGNILRLAYGDEVSAVVITEICGIADGIREVAPQTTVKIMNINRDDKNDALTEMWRSKAVLVGSPTINNGHSFAIAGLLEMASGLKFKNKKAAAFGSYGWGCGEWMDSWAEDAKMSNVSLAADPVIANNEPDDEARSACEALGAALV
jgi:flavorubredoxin